MFFGHRITQGIIAHKLYVSIMCSNLRTMTKQHYINFRQTEDVEQVILEHISNWRHTEILYKNKMFNK